MRADCAPGHRSAHAGSQGCRPAHLTRTGITRAASCGMYTPNATSWQRLSHAGCGTKTAVKGDPDILECSSESLDLEDGTLAACDIACATGGYTHCSFDGSYCYGLSEDSKGGCAVKADRTSTQQVWKVCPGTNALSRRRRHHACRVLKAVTGAYCIYVLSCAAVVALCRGMHAAHELVEVDVAPPHG